jgi:uncharacterized phage protein (TIGR01671 family)
MVSRFNFRAWHTDVGHKHMWYGGKLVSGQFVLHNKLLTEAKIMQSTGLIDENGVEIFEGDILHSRNLDYEVVWCANEFHTGWMKKSGDSMTDIGQTLADVLVVIGNIYENPEILEKGSNNGCCT